MSEDAKWSKHGPQWREPKDAAAARRIIEIWDNPKIVSTAKYVRRPKSFDRDGSIPAKIVVYPAFFTTPEMWHRSGVLAPVLPR